MKDRSSSLCILSIFLLLSGCATTGKQEIVSFNYEKVPQLTLQETTKQEAMALIGEPNVSKFRSNKDGEFELLEYQYVERAGYGAGSERNLSLEFRNGTLNGFVYTSNFSNDATDIDPVLHKNLQIGVSTKQDALRALGKPFTQSYCPSPFLLSSWCDGASEVWAWGCDQCKSSMLESSWLVISFDGNGVMYDMTLGGTK